MSMLRLARRSGRADLIRMVVSARSPADLYYAAELPGPESTVIYTRQPPAGSERGAGRLRVADVVPVVRGGEAAFVCGSAGFAESATTVLLEAGVPVVRIKVERFGPAG